MALFKTTAELKLHLPVNKDFNVEGIMPFIKSAEVEFIIPNISQTQYDDLNTAYNASATPTLTAAQTALLAKIQPALAHFAFNKWIPFGQVQIDSAGIRIATTESLKTAFQWQTKDLEANSLASGFANLETLLTYMEANKASYALWTASTSYTVFKESFINTAADFNKYFNINSSRITFLAFKAVMKKVEDFFVKAYLDATTYAGIKTRIAAGTTTAADTNLLAYIQPAVAHLTVANALKTQAVVINKNGFVVSKNVGFMTVEASDPAGAELKDQMIRQGTEDGNAYLKQLQVYLNTNATASVYADYYASDLYADPDTRPEQIDNTGFDGLVGI
jgi:hypothetical protein